MKLLGCLQRQRNSAWPERAAAGQGVRLLPAAPTGVCGGLGQQQGVCGQHADRPLRQAGALHQQLGSRQWGQGGAAARKRPVEFVISPRAL